MIASLFESDMVVYETMDFVVLIYLFGKTPHDFQVRVTGTPSAHTMADDASNALGLDFSQLTVADKQESVPEPNAVEENDTTSPTTKKEKGKPYVNPERVKTGGAQRVGHFLYSYQILFDTPL